MSWAEFLPVMIVEHIIIPLCICEKMMLAPLGLGVWRHMPCAPLPQHTHRSFSAPILSPKSVLILPVLLQLCDSLAVPLFIIVLTTLPSAGLC